MRWDEDLDEHTLQQVRDPSAPGSPSVLDVDPPAAAPPELTAREREVLFCMGRGMAPVAISRLLGISVHTCRGYVKSIHAKLGVRSQLEAVLKAQRLGIIDLADGP